LEKIPNIKIYDDCVNDPNIIIERIKDTEIVTANFIDLTSEIIKASPKLRYIISPAKGYDWIDVKTASERDVKVLNCPTYNAQAVAEHAIGLMFAVQRKIVNAHNAILDGKYPRDIVGTEISGKTLVTIGHGQIGKRIIKMSEGLGMKTLYVDSTTCPEEIDKLISQADVLVLCLPLNEKTKGIVDERRISLLKTSAVVINVARGLVVDSENLYKCLKENKIAGAGIDVFPKDETITQASEDIINFAKLPNVVATSHIAFNTKEAADRLGVELIEDIESCIKGKPINIVN
jgi:D-3-phosphoglycerate dehydrogenase